MTDDKDLHRLLDLARDVAELADDFVLETWRTIWRIGSGCWKGRRRTPTATSRCGSIAIL